MRSVLLNWDSVPDIQINTTLVEVDDPCVVIWQVDLGAQDDLQELVIPRHELDRVISELIKLRGPLN